MKYYPFAELVTRSNHTLIAGATGSGKSVLINDILYSLPFCAERAYSLVLCDPKRVDLGKWQNTRHCAGHYCTNKDICGVLQWFCESEMERRYKIMESRKIDKWDGSLYYIIIDEVADLMTTCRKEFLPLVQRIAQLGRAAGIHLIIATQSPSRLTIPAALTLNFDCRIALRCDSAIESRQIIGKDGAELLPRYGQCLIKTSFGNYKVPNIPYEPNVIAARIEEMKRPKGRYYTEDGRIWSKV